ncbi:TPA: hypothetical protein ACH3X2_013274 [Trebouxia sp. C0005]
MRLHIEPKCCCASCRFRHTSDPVLLLAQQSNHFAEHQCCAQAPQHTLTQKVGRPTFSKTGDQDFHQYKRIVQDMFLHPQRLKPPSGKKKYGYLCWAAFRSYSYAIKCA